MNRKGLELLIQETKTTESLNVLLDCELLETDFKTFLKNHKV